MIHNRTSYSPYRLAYQGLHLVHISISSRVSPELQKALSPASRLARKWWANQRRRYLVTWIYLGPTLSYVVYCTWEERLLPSLEPAEATGIVSEPGFRHRGSKYDSVGYIRHKQRARPHTGNSLSRNAFLSLRLESDHCNVPQNSYHRRNFQGLLACFSSQGCLY